MSYFFDTYKSKVPEGKCGEWSVKRFTVEEKDRIGQISSLFNSGRYVPCGKYTGLYQGDCVIMSDTPDEIRDHIGFIQRAHGDVLINGLGLGVCAQAVLNKKEVKSVTVVENSSDVVNLVFLHLNAKGKELKIIEADAYTWKPPKGARWDVVWHDIWPTLCTDNLKLMGKLHRKYGRRCTWQGSWGKEYLQRRRRQEQKEEKERAFWRESILKFAKKAGAPVVKLSSAGVEKINA